MQNRQIVFLHNNQLSRPIQAVQCVFVPCGTIGLARDLFNSQGSGFPTIIVPYRKPIVNCDYIQTYCLTKPVFCTRCTKNDEILEETGKMKVAHI